MLLLSASLHYPPGQARLAPPATALPQDVGGWVAHEWVCKATRAISKTDNGQRTAANEKKKAHGPPPSQSFPIETAYPSPDALTRRGEGAVRGIWDGAGNLQVQCFATSTPADQEDRRAEARACFKAPFFGGGGWWAMG